MSSKKKRGGPRSRRRKTVPGPYRSKFEAGLAERLEREGVRFEYERETFPITLDIGLVCPSCKERVTRRSRFTPDFFFRGWIVEAKGKFTARDRKRILALRDGWRDPEGRKLAMLFMRDNKLTKASKTRYTEWCAKHDIPCAVGWFAKEWLR